MATDNSTASGIATDTVKQKRSKAVDMQFYWIRDRVRQGQFQIYLEQVPSDPHRWRYFWDENGRGPVVFLRLLERSSK